jgi:hypothetical protein
LNVLDAARRRERGDPDLLGLGNRRAQPRTPDHDSADRKQQLHDLPL